MAAPSESLYARGFAADAETERALRAGLAGRETRIRRCRFDTALRTLAAEPSPKLVFVDLDGAPEPEIAVRELTAVCAFGTALIAIGTNDTAQLTRALLREGIADYLVKPLSAAAVRAASATALDDLPERMYAGRVVAFAGTAGSGVSTLVTAIARTVATGARTASVVELNPGSVTLSALLGVEPAGDLAALLASLGPGQHDVERDVDPPLDPDEPRDSDPAISAELVDSVCAPTGTAGISLIAYPSSGPLPEAPSPAGGAHASRNPGQPDARGAGGRTPRPERADRDHAAGRCSRAAVRADASQHQRGGALPRAARSGAPDHPGTDPSAHAQEHTFASSDQIRAGRTQPRRHCSVRAGAARGRHGRCAGPSAGEGVPGSFTPGHRTRSRGAGAREFLSLPLRRIRRGNVREWRTRGMARRMAAARVARPMPDCAVHRTREPKAMGVARSPMIHSDADCNRPQTSARPDDNMSLRGDGTSGSGKFGIMRLSNFRAGGVKYLARRVNTPKLRCGKYSLSGMTAN